MDQQLIFHHVDQSHRDLIASFCTQFPGWEVVRSLSIDQFPWWYDPQYSCNTSWRLRWTMSATLKITSSYSEVNISSWYRIGYPAVINIEFSNIIFGRYSAISFSLLISLELINFYRYHVPDNSIRLWIINLYGYDGICSNSNKNKMIQLYFCGWWMNTDICNPQGTLLLTYIEQNYYMYK